MRQNDELGPAAKSRKSSGISVAAGVFLTVLAAYVLANPGRIDLIDGQIRYEVAMNWVTMGRPVLMDPTLLHMRFGITGQKGFTYSYYGSAASVAAMPLVWMGTFYDDPPGEATRFLFSLTTSVFGAIAAGFLYLFYLELGVTAKEALVWTGVATFATLMWPASDSAFDNAQHACLVLIAVFIGYKSGERKSPYLAATGGLVAGLLLDFQEYFALLIPVLALSTIDESGLVGVGQSGVSRTALRFCRRLFTSRGRHGFRNSDTPAHLTPEVVHAFHRACWRYAFFLLATLVGLGLALEYNHLCFGSLFETGKFPHKAQTSYPLFGNPLAGLLTLLVSPGKSILLYSPPIILGFAGLRRLWRNKPQLGFVIVAVSVVLVMFISTIAFAGGDWCWGPRYLVPLIPLWALAFPFAPIASRQRRDLATVIVGVGLLLQCLAVCVEHQRFFFERGLEDWFWARDPWFYMKHSALAARPGEALALIKGPPPEASLFNTNGNPPTYTALGPPKGLPRSRAPVWMRHFRVFYVPRPWPLWMWEIPPDQRALNLTAWLAGIFGVALLGFALLRRGLQYAS